MAEHICGNEEEFVRQMNKRAKSLGMEHTNFVNCNGLDADNHLTTARDIALMSRELIMKYPQIHEYCMIWMENITHATKKGTSEFGLTNTNKLVRQYEYATGLKTGSTSQAKFCVSATAKKNDVELIAVIMAADDSKTRFKDAVTLLNHGFGKCQIYKDDNPPQLENLYINGSLKEYIGCEYEKEFVYLDLEGSNFSSIEKSIQMNPETNAPVKKGDTVGKLVYSLDNKEIGSINIISSENADKAGFGDYFKHIASLYFTRKK